MSGDVRDFNKIETRAVIKFLFLQGTAPKEIDPILTKTLDCFLPARAKYLSAPLYVCMYVRNFICFDVKKSFSKLVQVFRYRLSVAQT